VKSGDNRRPTANPYQSQRKQSVNGNPIASIVDRQQSLRKLQRRLRQVAQRIEKVPGGQPIWRLFEEISNEYYARREEAIFNLGYEHGFSAARVEALRTLPSQCSSNVQLLGELGRIVAVQTDLPTGARVAILLEAVWTLSAAVKQNQGTKKERT
jgi:hypothetical protein